MFQNSSEIPNLVDRTSCISVHAQKDKHIDFMREERRRTMKSPHKKIVRRDY